MTKPELGTKRLCARCGVKFYGLLHSPITCPKCGTVLATPDANNSRVRVKATREPEREFESVVGVAPGTQFVSPADTDVEADGEQGADVLPKSDDDDDEDLDDVVLVEDSDEEDGDVGDVRRTKED
jgi:uncharacterized protein (TIGR02300 family)